MTVSTPSNSPLRTCLEEALRLANLDDSFMNQQIEISTDADHINERLASIDAKLSNSENEHLFNQAVIGELKSKILICEETIDSYAADVARYKSISENCAEEVTQLKFDINEINYELAEADDYSKHLERELNSLQQYTRRESVEISGIPDALQQRDLEEVVIGLLRRIGVYQLEGNEISACHRLKRRKGDRSCNVIVKFVNTKRVFECLSNRKHIRDTIHQYPNMYIHENLCPNYCVF